MTISGRVTAGNLPAFWASRMAVLIISAIVSLGVNFTVPISLPNLRRNYNIIDIDREVMGR
jgi:hypothetical protein